LTAAAAAQVSASREKGLMTYVQPDTVNWNNQLSPQNLNYLTTSGTTVLPSLPGTLTFAANALVNR